MAESSSPQVSVSEKERLEALRSYQILDTPLEEQYDDLVTLAAQICDMPMASITLVDETRQWFKASIGFKDRETPRAISFCSRAIAQKEEDLFIVGDARHDPRFRDFPNVTGDPNIGFYAGAPLITHDGWALGTLCVIDHRPRKLTPEQARALRVLRRHVVNALELHRLVNLQNGVITELKTTRRHLEIAREEAEAAGAAKSRFLAAMSHEIRTPMNAVIGMTALLRSTSLDAEQADCVDTIRTSGELLLTIINDILDFSKIDSGRLEFEQAPFLVAACVADAVDLLSAPAEAKGLVIRTEIKAGVPPCILGDITRVRQILVNLLSNAVKFTSNGTITVAVTSQTSANGAAELTFSVRDTGIGIPANRLDLLFLEFSQIDVSTTRRYGGTGLGLAISKRLSEMHGGRMWAESRYGEGSTFFFTIIAPIAESPSLPPASRHLDTFDTGFALRHPARILIAEDNQVNQKVASRTLEKLGYSPEIAANGLEALVALRRQPFDLVLMDVEMPEMDGLTATRALRAEFPRESQPVVAAVTAHALVGNREQYLDAGMDHYLTKPLRLADLTALLARVPTLLAAHRK
ncbi:MAG TPA: ATP-binding protein [Rariglobus sp.]|jgi:signal transduction histidine kinase/ActR/RegA family two-component response regulator|nr:ATP-binding protein [Rariglobus sp.]